MIVEHHYLTLFEVVDSADQKWFVLAKSIVDAIKIADKQVGGGVAQIRRVPCSRGVLVCDSILQRQPSA